MIMIRSSLCALFILTLFFVPTEASADDLQMDTQIAMTGNVPDPPGLCPGLELAKAALPEKMIVIDQELIAAAKKNLEGMSGKKKQVSVHIPMPEITADKWERLETSSGDFSWRIVIKAEGAAFIRPHLAKIPELDNQKIIAYGDPGNADSSVLVKRTKTSTTKSLWGPIVKGELYYLEFVGKFEQIPDVSIDKISYGLDDPPVQVSSWCYLDPTCYSDWDDYKSAVGLMYVEEGGDGYVCTGSLLMDTSESFAPWFLTANHCLGSSSEADSLRVTWYYFTDTCNGSAPSWYDLPFSDGAELKASSPTSDFSLVLLDEAPPAGTAFLGWSIQPAAVNDPITVLHHPAGEYQRITLGDITRQTPSFWKVRYSQSSTEGGSSGSPLINSNYQVIGQLYGGMASCDFMLGADEFGRFDVSWVNGIGDYLNNGQPTDDDDDAGDDDDDDDYSDDDDTWNPDDGSHDDLKSGDDDDEGCGWFS